VWAVSIGAELGSLQIVTPLTHGQTASENSLGDISLVYNLLQVAFCAFPPVSEHRQNFSAYFFEMFCERFEFDNFRSSQAEVSWGSPNHSA